MVFFISDSLSALGSDISVRESVGSRADEGSDMKKAMLGVKIYKKIPTVKNV